MGLFNVCVVIALAGVCMAGVDEGVPVTNENRVESHGHQGEGRKSAMCKDTCTLGSSDKTTKVCVNTGGEKPEEFPNECLYRAELCRFENGLRGGDFKRVRCRD